MSTETMTRVPVDVKRNSSDGPRPCSRHLRCGWSTTRGPADHGRRGCPGREPGSAGGDHAGLAACGWLHGVDRRASRYRHLVVTLSDGTPAITSMVFGLQRHLAVAAGRLALATRDAYGTRVYDAAGRRRVTPPSPPPRRSGRSASESKPCGCIDAKRAGLERRAHARRCGSCNRQGGGGESLPPLSPGRVAQWEEPGSFIPETAVRIRPRPWTALSKPAGFDRQGESNAERGPANRAPRRRTPQNRMDNAPARKRSLRVEESESLPSRPSKLDR